MDDLSPNQANRLSGAQGYWGTAFVLALIAHGLLFVLLFVSMQWRSEPTGPVYAELWNGDMPAAEAPAETQPEPQPEPEPEPEKPGNAGMLLLVLAVMGIGGGAAWYFKIYRPKHQQADQPEEDDGGEYPDYDEFEDDGPPWDEEDETEEKEEIR